MTESLAVGPLLAGYRAHRFTVAQVIERVHAQIDAAPERHVWISRLPREQVMAYVRRLETLPPDALPLYGVPFAIKDNIDLEGWPTTAACPEFAYVPKRSAFVVQRLIAAGAVPIGKTNLDQFATGLVGTRSPYGACMNSINPAFVSGGSSSGSAVAVASGLVSFALGTDTAGSGRVPAAFNNIIGLKPTCGRLSTSGVVPACRSIDCVSVFALTSDDAAQVLAVAEGYDAGDPYSRPVPVSATSIGWPTRFRFGVPHASQLEFFGDREYEQLFHAAERRLQALGGERVEIDFAPFREAAKLLYEGAWIAERYVAVGEFIDRKPEYVHPVTRQLISAARSLSAADVFRTQHRLMEARRAALQAWGDIDVLVTPTTGTVYRIAEIDADPIRLNSNLGFYTNFVNFLDFAAVAVPAGFRTDGLPFGVTVIGLAWSDARLLSLADRLHRASVSRAGALNAPLPPVSPDASVTRSLESPARIHVAVCGAHMERLALNPQLTSRGATLHARTRTAPMYQFYALPGGPPFRPGLVRVHEGGASIEVEVWSVPAEHFGSFVAEIPAPLAIGRVELENGESVSGFICEAHATRDAEDITRFGGWRAYIAARSSGA